jgi:hypothetical protein
LFWVLICAVGATAFGGKVSVSVSTYVNNDKIVAYTYTTEVSGYPPMPYDAIIMGGDMTQTRSYGGAYNYSITIEAYEQYVGYYYDWRAKRRIPNSYDLGEVVGYGTAPAY